MLVPRMQKDESILFYSKTMMKLQEGAVVNGVQLATLHASLLCAHLQWFTIYERRQADTGETVEDRTSNAWIMGTLRRG